MLPSALKQKLAAQGAKPPSTTRPLKPHNNKRKPNPPADAPKPKKSIKSRTAAEHRKPLTTDEINRLQESTNTLTNENLFTLQIDEILRASQIPAKYEQFIVGWLRDFNAHITALPSDATRIASADLPSASIPMDERRVYVPDFQFQFIAPRTPATLIGSMATATAVGPLVHVDIAVEMPAQCFQKDNYMNLVYHKKRALYLRRLADALSSWSPAGQPQFAFFRGDRLRPVIQLRPNAPGVKKLRVHIHVAGEANAFKLNRFLPGTSNVRAALFGDVDDGQQLHPTPHYNAGILRDLTLAQNEQFVQRMLQPAANCNVREALVLFKLWLRTRGLDGTAFGGHVAAAFAVHLIKQRRVHVTMTTYEVLRNMWIQLATSRWHETGHGVSLTPQPATALEVFHQHFDVVFVDVSGYLNLAAQLPLDVYLRVREESKRALSFLTTATLSSFRHLFTGRRPAFQQYDHVLNITHTAGLSTIVANAIYRSQYYDHCAQTLPIVQDIVCNVLRQGLGRRVDSLTPIVPTPSVTAWNVDEPCPAAAQRFAIGLVLNAELCTDVLDKGPQADQVAEAEAFRSFWGSRSEMRRFQDGSIVEACVWTAPNAPLAARRMICRQIVVHLLQHHFTIGEEHVRYVADQLDIVYRVDEAKVPDQADSNSEHLALAVVHSFDELGRQLRSLDDIPLAITGCTGASPAFRYCEVEPCLATASVAAATDAPNAPQIFQSYAVLEAVIELSASGRWPANLEALQRLKAAFCLRIAAGLRNQCQLAARTDGRWVDCIKDGYHFRLRIVLDKELMLLKRTLNAKGVVAYRDTDASRAYERDMIRLPRLTVLLHTLYHQHSSFGPAVMVAKRWLRAQLIDGFLWPDECTELLMARVYTQPDSWPAPVQPQAAFVRWLQLLATGDWQREIVVLNFNDGLSETQLARLESKFANDRDAFPFLCIVTAAAATTAAVVASDTKTAAADWTVWSAEAPLREVVARVAVLATHSVDIVAGCVWGDGGRTLEPALLFVPSLEGYDVLIRLRRAKVQQSQLCGFGASRRGGRRPDEAPPAADFNVVQRYLRTLREAYGEFAVFFYDSCGGDTVAVMWKPAVHVEREFTMSAVMGCHELEEESGKYVCNLKQFVEDFRVIGHGLVEKIDVTADDEE